MNPFLEICLNKETLLLVFIFKNENNNFRRFAIEKKTEFELETWYDLVNV
jgi:hypothetical protein